MSEVVIRREGTGWSSRGTVGGALRILMTRHAVGIDDAFELLVRAARRAQLTLPEVAEGVVRAGSFRGPGGPRTCRLDRPQTPRRRGTPYCRAINPATPTR